MSLVGFTCWADVPFVVQGLTTEFVECPMGIDVTRPRLGWKLQSERRGQTQSAYRILFASSPALLAQGKGDLWDSGRVSSGKTLEIAYSGTPIQSATRYHWKVKAWDAEDRESEWSSPSFFETGLLSAGDWQGKWIGWGANRTAPPLPLSDANWIWVGGKNDRAGSPAGTCYFRRTVVLPAGKPIVEALFAGSADDNFILHVNGQLVARGSSWDKPVFVSLDDCLRPGVNVIAVRAQNNVAGPAGFIGKLKITFADGTTLLVPTDATWKAASHAPLEWQGQALNDSAWACAGKIAAFRDGPWGRLTLPSLKVPAPLPAPLFRKEFTLKRPVASARLYICGLGLYEARLNGRRVGDSVLNPAHTQYDQRVLYVSYDVTGQLQQGGNCLGVELGRGFFSVLEQTPWQWSEAPWVSTPKLLCQLNVRYDDGSTASIASDDSWGLCTDGPTTYDSIYWGERYDARKEKPGWDRPGYDGGGFSRAMVVAAPTGQLRSQMLPPMRVVETRRPISVTSPKPGHYAYDVGLVTAGWIRFTAACPAGTEIAIRYTERLTTDGTAVPVGLNDVDGLCQTDRYTFKGQGIESWEPKFSYKGFKYIEVLDCPVPLTLENVEILGIWTDVRTTGSFECSNPDFNRLHGNMVRTLLNNFHGKPTDTPTYEKNGWTGDANFALDCMFYNFDLAAFMTKWMDDCRDCMHADGNVPIIVPAGVWGYGWHPVWSTVYLYGLEALQKYADVNVLFNEHFDVARKYTAYNMSRLVDGIATDRNSKGHGVMCDHLAPGLEERSTGQAPPEGGALGSTAYIHGTLRIMADKAEALGQAELAGRYRADADALRQAFNRHFLDPKTGVYHTDILEIADMKDRTKKIPVGYRQTSNLIALAFDLVPAEMRQAVVDNLVRDIVSRDYHLDTGAAGTRHILPVLTESGHGDVAYKVATQTTYPSWGHQLSLGATTMWECWRNPRSNDHYFMGTIDEWFFKHLAGIRDIKDGFREFTIKPYPVGDLTYVRAKLETVRGSVVSSWTRDPGKDFRLEVTVPVNATATVYVPAGVADVVKEGDRAADEAPGVRFLHQADGYAVYRVLSGAYVFRVIVCP